MRELRILPTQEGKGRTFRATLISYVSCHSLWAPGSNDTIRPIWMMVAGSETELRPFVANLQLGRKAEAVGNYRRSDRFEFLKSAKFQVIWQRTIYGSIATLFEPDLFRLDPGMVDPKGVQFCLLPSKDWLSTSTVDIASLDWLSRLTFTVPELRREEIVRVAPLFIAYLDRRTRCPLIPDVKFYIQVLAAALNEGIATWSDESAGWYGRGEYGKHAKHRFVEYGTEQANLSPGIVVDVSHETLETFLAEQVSIYFELSSNLTNAA